MIASDCVIVAGKPDAASSSTSAGTSCAGASARNAGASCSFLTRWTGRYS